MHSPLTRPLLRSFLSRPRDDETFHVLYVKSHNRATVYLIGMSVGYFLYAYKDSPKRLSKVGSRRPLPLPPPPAERELPNLPVSSQKLTISASLLWLLLMFAPMAYGSLFYDSERPYDAVEAAIFASARRVSWAIAFSVFVLVHRFGKIRE